VVLSAIYSESSAHNFVRCVKVWHFYPILSVVYFFPGHNVVFLQPAYSPEYYCATTISVTARNTDFIFDLLIICKN